MLSCGVCVSGMGGYQSKCSLSLSLLSRSKIELRTSCAKQCSTTEPYLLCSKQVSFVFELSVLLETGVTGYGLWGYNPIAKELYVLSFIWSMSHVGYQVLQCINIYILRYI